MADIILPEMPSVGGNNFLLISVVEQAKNLNQRLKRIAQAILPASIYPIVRRVWRFFRLRRWPRRKTNAGSSASALACCIAYNDHGGFCIPLSSRHRPAVQAILRGEVWERETIDYIRSHVGDGDIIHAGTYYGDFLPGLSRSIGPGAVVWAFEPNPENVRCARITIEMNGLANIRLTAAALGEREGTLSLVITDAKGIPLGGASHVHGVSHPDGDGDSIVIPMTTLDDAIGSDRRISIVQLDVEGYERSVLAGAMKIIRRCKPILILESLPDQSWLSENLFPLGYRVEGRVEENTILRVMDSDR